MKTEILIVGSGCAGLYCALNLPAEKDILVISKADLESSDSYLAQGGMCMLKDEDDFDSFFEDTMHAGHYENDPESVRIMIESSTEVVEDLLEIGSYCRETSSNLSRHYPPSVICMNCWSCRNIGIYG